MKNILGFLKRKKELPNPSPFPGIDPADSLDEKDIVERYKAEEHRNCDAIDARLSALEEEFKSLNKEYNRLTHAGASPTLVREIVDKLDINRDLRKVLYKARYVRT